MPGGLNAADSADYDPCHRLRVNGVRSWLAIAWMRPPRPARQACAWSVCGTEFTSDPISPDASA